MKSTKELRTDNNEEVSDTTSSPNKSIELLSETDQIYHKRSGTVDKGKEYEKCVTTYLILKTLKNNEFQDSSVWSNDEKFGDFDDIILEVKHKDNTEEKFAIQLKHVSQRKTLIQPEKFKGEKANFSIKKYIESYKKYKNSLETCQIILWTNSSFCLCTKNNIIDLSKEMNLTLEITECVISPLLLTSQKAKCFNFKILKSGLDCNSSEFKIYKEFFDRFILCTDQSHFDDLEIYVTNLANQMFPYEKSFLNSLSEYIKRWSLNEKKAVKLDKDIIRKVIALQLLNNYIHPVFFESICKEHKLFQVVIRKFDVTVFKKESLEIIRKIWGNTKNKLLPSDQEKEVGLCLQNYQIAPPNIKVEELDEISLSKLLWLMGKCPLIVEGSPTTYQAIELCKGQKFILIEKSFNRKSVEGFAVFDKLSDLKQSDENMYIRLTREICCKLPGNEINLSTLIEEKPEILDTLTTDELLKMINQPFILKQDKEKLPDAYINRKLFRTFINPNYLQEDNKKDVILVSNVSEENEKHELFENYKLTLVEKYLEGQEKSSNSRGFKHQKRILYISRKENLQEEFHKMCSQFENMEECHCFKFVEGELEWIRSNRGASKLNQVIISGKGCLDENKAFTENSHNNINIIVGDPGIGKTILLKKLKNNFCPYYLTIIFTPTDISKLVQANSQFPDNIEKCIVDVKFPNSSNFEKNILRYLIGNGMVVYLWDALDEITDEERLTVGNIISNFSDKSKMQVVTTRRHLKNFFEEEFDVLSRNIRPFDVIQQKSYIEKRLEIVFPNKNKFESILEKITANISNYSHKDILGIPLQIYMITELFIKNPQKYIELFTELFSLTELYHNFIEEKFNIYFDQKRNLQGKDKELWFQDFKTRRILDYKTVAYNALFFDQQSDKSDNFLNQIKEKGDYLGLIVDVRKDKLLPEFIHSSYGDYFAALYLVDHCKELPNLAEIIFERKYTNVRYFFDTLMAKESPQHIAVLCKNVSKLKEYEGDLNKKDLQGRNLLHLASSWSEKYPLLDVKESSDNTYFIDNRCQYPLQCESPHSRKLFKYVLQNCHPDEEDHLFGYTSTKYAEKSDCLFAVAMIERKKESKYFKSKNSTFICNLLYYGLVFDLPDVFDMLDDVKFICNNNGDSLLHVAVRQNNIYCFKKILTTEIYRRKIDAENKKGETALIIAAKTGYTTIVQLLLQHGANIEASDENCQTALFWAVIHRHEETIQLLIELGANINAVNDDGCTPLFEASFHGLSDVVRILLEKNANINTANNFHETPLFGACKQGHSNVVKILIDNNSDVNAATYDGITPLLAACQEGHLHVAEILIENNANINSGSHYDVCHFLIGWTHIISNLMNILYFSRLNVNNNNNLKHSLAMIRAVIHELAKEKNVKQIVEIYINLIFFYTDICWNILVGPVLHGNYKRCGEVLEEFHSNMLNILTTNDEIELVKTCTKYFSRFILIYCRNNIMSMNEHDKILLLETLEKWWSNFFLIVKKDNINMDTIKNIIYLLRTKQEVKNYLLYVSKIIFDTNYLLMLSKHDIKEIVKQIAKKIWYFLNTIIEDNPNIMTLEILDATPLFVACKNGYFDVVKLLIENRVNINAALKNGATPLYIACQKGHLTIVKFLLENGADVNAAKFDVRTQVVETFQKSISDVAENLNEMKNDPRKCVMVRKWAEECHKFLLNIFDTNDKNAAINNGMTPLHVASFNGHLDVVRLLAENQGNINAVTNEGRTPLFVACQNGQSTVVQMLIENNAEINTATELGLTPLHIASAKGYIDVVQLLLKNNADINAAAVDGNKPLHITSFGGHLDVLKILLKNNVDIHEGNQKGETPLHLASLQGHSNVVEVLIDHGANIDTTAIDGSTPLTAASFEGYLDVVNVLLSNNANINAKNREGRTPLYEASWNGHINVLKVLIEHGAKIDETAIDSSTPLIAASFKGHLDVVNILLANNANINATIEDGFTSLYFASWNGHTNVVKVLIERGAIINRTAIDSIPPLIFAASFNGHLDVVKVLLDNNVNIHAKDKIGETSLHIASRCGHVNVVKLLIEKNADIHAARNDGATPLFVACETGYLNVVQILLEHKANINVPRNDGTTPFFIALRNRHMNIVRILMKKHAVMFCAKTLILTGGWLLSMIFHSSDRYLELFINSIIFP